MVLSATLLQFHTQLLCRSVLLKFRWNSHAIAGDELWVHDHDDGDTNADWYQGYSKDGKQEGLVPRNYVP